MSEIHGRVQDVFRQVFVDPAMVITANTRAADVEEWDSLAHINLVVALEQAFGIRFRLAELDVLRDVGDLEALVGRKLEA